MAKRTGKLKRQRILKSRRDWDAAARITDALLTPGCWMCRLNLQHRVPAQCDLAEVSGEG